MKKKVTAVTACLLACILASACTPTVQTVEVTRVVEQTVVVTQLVTQMEQVNITMTPILAPTTSPTFAAPKWTPSAINTQTIRLTLTPGLQVADENTRVNIEKFVSAESINYSFR